MAPESYPTIKRLRDNLIPIDYFANIITSPVPEPKPYGIDGPLTTYQNGSNLWLYAAMRRGGRTIYSFNVSNINAGSSPILKWRKGCDATGCEPNLDEIGQTWSSPVVLKAAGFGSGTSPMLIMGGGYDPCEDTDPFDSSTCSGSPSGTPKGNRIYVLDANSGDWVTEFTTERGVVADVFVVKDAATGLAKWAYVADLGGNIYRIGSGLGTNAEFGLTNPALDWTMTKIASLGCTPPAPNTPAPTSCPGIRKFMMSLDVVDPNDGSGSYVILVGSGDREKPLMGFTEAYGVSNYFFKIVDRPTVTNWLSSETGCGGLICLGSLLSIGASDPTATALAAHPKGWYLALNPHEQVVTSAITVFGTITFSTHTPHVPVAGSCSSTLGTARVYNIALTNAASRNGTLARNQEIVGGGLPPSPVAGMVMLDDGTTLPFLIGGETTSPLEGMEPVPSGMAAQPKSQTYWYIHK